MTHFFKETKHLKKQYNDKYTIRKIYELTRHLLVEWHVTLPGKHRIPSPSMQIYSESERANFTLEKNTQRSLL